MLVEGPRAAPELIETMCLAQGRIALWSLHLARLRRSAAGLGYPLNMAALQQGMDAGIARLDPSGTHHLRLLLDADGGIHLESRPLAPTVQPVQVVLAPAPRLDGDAGWLAHKSTHRPWYEAAQAWLQAHPAVFDMVFLDNDGGLTEGSRSNVYVSPDGVRWLTPPLSAGVLPGVQRQALLDAGRVEEAALDAEDLRRARALRVSNALRGWLDARLVSAP
ncbi:MAG: aminotransferase class IV [Castellaniella sp.]